MAFKVGDEVEVYAAEAKRVGKVVAILHPGSKSHDFPVIVQHTGFGQPGETIYQSFSRDGESSNGACKLKRCPNYRYAGVYAGVYAGNRVAATEWYNDNVIAVGSFNYAGTLRCDWVDGKPTDIEFSKDGVFK